MQSALSAVNVSASTESSSTAVSWGPIIAGAFAASTLTFILMLLGSGLGLTMVSPWSGSSASITTFAVSTAVWLVIVQWLSSAVGGYLAGRLRTKWVGIHTDEVYFRDTAHGFLAWALATLLVVGVLGSALSAAIGSGVQAASTVASGAAMGASAGATTNASGASADNATSYLVDSLFRPADPAKLAATNQGDEAAAAGQASRILIAGAVAGEVTAEDKTYLAQLVAARTGLSEADAKTRVDAVLAKAQDAKVKAKQAADTARKASATFALLGALSLVIGAFIASAAAALGGRQRDEEEAVFLTNG
ncbi:MULTISPECIES: hypothetical protein [unclassified Mesorhizobium]|uniref:hypothetical protein n=1 Tax=unclassified Mesorhizobium TaxID=325217 RepID=UPI000FD3FAA9|nr:MULTISPECIES: hypothetical protein [unclassified Mesorhizobium]RUW99176.1 hypothetical protein EOA30_24460 [Mesorhizobium sp. M8A.F.Ca.ET.059.01.1.1]RUX04597.1 hypothetical protein EOA35_09770 [Mesorhizobium sp. M8A.F.Ca.ET.023.01.1.1]RWC74601.1 MAG: hypothetical protein EOS71_12790 [Mesorhizobium sp.]TGR38117.1 hypothetical protein EN842_47005 [bacterium M00.F.Ca.ET.199.01.1.1]TGU26411.1 hypothetical protein EN799_43565 [bacterium M00.F.Ca.ET.156.01.1.1]TGV83111.1 hypothetical protein EN7